MYGRIIKFIVNMEIVVMYYSKIKGFCFLFSALVVFAVGIVAAEQSSYWREYKVIELSVKPKSTLLLLNQDESAGSYIVADLTKQQLSQLQAFTTDLSLLLSTHLVQVLHPLEHGIWWSWNHYQIHTGDFNGDQTTDLLLQSRSDAHQHAILLADQSEQLTHRSEFFDNYYLGLDWSAKRINLVLGDYNGDGSTDIVSINQQHHSAYLIWVKQGQLSLPIKLDLNITDLSNTDVSAQFDPRLGYALLTASNSATGSTQWQTDLSVLADSSSEEQSVASSSTLNAYNSVSSPQAEQIKRIVPGDLNYQSSIGQDGTLNITVPLRLPKGAGELTPRVALKYNSLAGIGVLGMGWHVTPSSQISRCHRSIEAHGAVSPIRLDHTDAYCLDGTPLKLYQALSDHTHEYRMDHQPGVRVLATGITEQGATSFEVKLPNGETHYYGQSDNATIVNQQFGVIISWLVERVEDTNTNYYQYRYDDNNSQRLLKQIAYSGNHAAGVSPALSIHFHYQPSPSIHYRYLAGQELQIDQMLQSITLNHQQTTYLSYLLDYAEQPSQLRSIHECGQGGICKPPIVFDWQTANTDYHKQSQALQLPNPEHALAIDVNGDLITDWITPYQGTYNVYLGLSNQQLSGPIQTGILSKNTLKIIDVNGDGIQDILSPELPNWVAYTWNGKALATLQTQVPVGVAEQTYIVDVNGDALQDILILTPQAEQRVVYFNQGGHFSKASPITINWANDYGALRQEWLYISNHQARPYDFNGDGVGDLLMKVRLIRQVGPHQSQSSTHRYYWMSFIGDGKGNYDFHHLVGNAAEPNAGGAGTIIAERTMYDPYMIDINQDGLSDLIYRMAGDHYFKINHGRGFKKPVKFSSSIFAGLAKWYDYDHDGVLDVAIPDQKHWQVTLIKNENSAQTINLSIPFELTEAGRYKMASTNADMSHEWIYFGGSQPTIWSQSLTPQPDLPLIERITSSYGRVESYQYELLSELNHRHVKDIQQDYIGWGNGSPVFSILTSQPVVVRQRQSVIALDEQADSNQEQALETLFEYYDARWQGGGRGFLGFGTQVIIKPQFDHKVVKTFAQQPPFTGLMTNKKTYQSGQLVEDETSRYKVATINHISMRYPTEVSKQHFDEKGTRLYTMNKSMHYDAEQFYYHGQPQRVIESTTDQYGHYKKQTEVTFNHIDDAPIWKTGLASTTQIVWQRDQKKSIKQEVHSEFDQRGNLVKYIREPYQPSLKLVEEHVFNAFGLVVTTSQAASNQIRHQQQIYDHSGRFLISSINAEGHTVHSNYHPFWGGMVLQTDPNGLATHYRYDSLGRLQSTIKPGHRVTKQQWSFSNTPLVAVEIKTTSSEKPDQVEYFDFDGKLQRTVVNVTSQRSIATEYFYHFNGKPAKVSQPYYLGDSKFWTTMQYDQLGRETQRRQASGQHTTFHYSGLDKTTIAVDGTTKIERYNALGEIISMIDPMGMQSALHYDAVGNSQALETEHGVQSYREYDSAGQLIREHDPAFGQRVYHYNAFGELVETRDALNRSIIQEYDQLGRMTVRRAYDQHGVLHQHQQWRYDGEGAMGALHHAIDHMTGYQQTYQYDHLGRPVATHYQEGDDTWVATKQYNARHLVETIQFASGDHVKYHYDPLGQLTGISDLNAQHYYWKILDQTAHGHPLVKRWGNQLTTQYSYLPGSDRLTHIVTQGQSLVQDWRMHWNDKSELIHRDNQIQQYHEAFHYDALGRLMEVTASDQHSLSISYDALGNILNKNNVGDYYYRTTNPSRLDHIKSTQDSAAFVYDQIGNLIQSDQYQVVYNLLNQAKQVKSGDTMVKYDYDFNGQIVREVRSTPQGNMLVQHMGHSRRIVTDQNILWKTTLPGGVVLTTRQNTDPVPSYLHTDHTGTVDAVTDQTGEIVQQNRFTAFGELIKHQLPVTASLDLSSLIEQLARRLIEYAGHSMVGIRSLVHMGARLYDARLARFISPDPIIKKLSAPQSWNRYAYALNAPLHYHDPSGLFFSSFFKKMKNFVSTWWRPVAAIGATLMTFGALGGMVSAGLAATSLSPLVQGMVSSVITGAAAGFVGTLVSQQSLKGALQGAIAGGITAGLSAYWSLVPAANWISRSKQLLSAAVGGCIASVAVSAQCIKGSMMSTSSYLLHWGLRQLSHFAPTLDTPERGGLIKRQPTGALAAESWRTDVCDVTGQLCGPEYLHIGIAKTPLTTTTRWYHEDSYLSQWLGSIPGLNSAAVSHDALVGRVQRGLDIANQSSKRMLQLLTNQISIVPTVAAHYHAAGLTQYWHERD